MNSIQDVWVYLAASPLFGLVLTLVVFQLMQWIYRYFNHNPALNPVAWSVVSIILVLMVLDIEYHHYFDGAQFIHFLLGPATVALAIPLYQYRHQLLSLWLPIMLATTLGLLVAGVSAFMVAYLLGASDDVMMSLIPKSVTAPVAMSLAEMNGGVATLTAAFVVLTGIMGAMFGPLVFRVMRLKDERVMGIAMGVSAHGIGTAKAFHLGAQMGAFSGLAMALAALLSGFLLPTLMSLLQP